MKKILNLTIIALVSFLSACSTVNTVERAEANATPNLVNDKRIITDGGLSDYAYVAQVSERYVGGLLQIQAKIVNSTSATRQVNYKFTWFDKSGMVVPSATSTWLTLVIEGGQNQYISAVAPSKNACDFKLELLPNKRD